MSGFFPFPMTTILAKRLFIFGSVSHVSQRATRTGVAHGKEASALGTSTPKRQSISNGNKCESSEPNENGPRCYPIDHSRFQEVHLSPAAKLPVTFCTGYDKVPAPSVNINGRLQQQVASFILVANRLRPSFQLLCILVALSIPEKKGIGLWASNASISQPRLDRVSVATLGAGGPESARKRTVIAMPLDGSKSLH
jgi:hypothetical protein